MTDYSTPSPAMKRGRPIAALWYNPGRHGTRRFEKDAPGGAPGLARGRRSARAAQELADGAPPVRRDRPPPRVAPGPGRGHFLPGQDAGAGRDDRRATPRRRRQRPRDPRDTRCLRGRAGRRSPGALQRGRPRDHGDPPPAENHARFGAGHDGRHLRHPGGRRGGGDAARAGQPRDDGVRRGGRRVAPRPEPSHADGQRARHHRRRGDGRAPSRA